MTDSERIAKLEDTVLALKELLEKSIQLLDGATKMCDRLLTREENRLKASK